MTDKERAMLMHGTKLLYVDDNEDTVDVVTLLLKLDGIEVTSAGTVNDAMALIREQKFDYYLLDHQLPDGNGLEMCLCIRAFDANTPIFLFSAMDPMTERKRALAAGAQGFIRKPEDVECLGEILYEHSRKSRESCTNLTVGNQAESTWCNSVL